MQYVKSCGITSLPVFLHGILFLSIVFSWGCLLPCIGRTNSMVSDPIQWLWATCSWVFLKAVSSLMEACESQQQLHGDGLHQEHCVRYGQRISSVVPLPCWKATLTLPWHLHFLYDECRESSGSCREPMYQMHLWGHTSTLLWPKFHANTSGLELCMSYTAISWYLACRVWLPDPFSSRFMQVQAMPIFSVPRLCCYQRTQSCFPDRQMSQPLQLVHLPSGLLRIMMSYQTEGSWFWINLSEDKRSCFFLYNCQSKDKHFQYFCQ